MVVLAVPGSLLTGDVAAAWQLGMSMSVTCRGGLLLACQDKAGAHALLMLFPPAHAVCPSLPLAAPASRSQPFPALLQV